MAILPMVAMRKICEVNDIPDSNVDKPMTLYRITRFGSEGIVQQGDTLAVEDRWKFACVGGVIADGKRSR